MWRTAGKRRILTAKNAKSAKEEKKINHSTPRVRRCGEGTENTKGREEGFNRREHREFRGMRRD
jgi:hypothetical protein